MKPKILILETDSTSAVDTKTDKLILSAFHNEIPDTHCRSSSPAAWPPRCRNPT